MSAVLVVADDPVGACMAGPGIRALEIARALSAAGLSVTLAAPEAVPRVVFEATVAYARDPAALRSAATATDALVVCGTALVRLPFLAASERPIAVDLYAPGVLENLSAVAAGGPSAVERERRHGTDLAALSLQLRRGDFFFCASEVQRDFWMGMLTAVGRVNPATHGRDPSLRGLIDVVPFGLPDAPPIALSSRALRGVWPGIDPGAQIVLWSGGLWDWLDPVTLVRAAALLGTSRPELRVAFLGGRTPSPNVPEMAAAAAARRAAAEVGVLDRSVVFSDAWVPYEDRAAYLLEADLAASLHLPHVEARYAYRTRLLDCIWAGLPMVVTRGDVLSDLVASRGLGAVVPPCDPEAVAAAIETLLDAPGGRRALAQRFTDVAGALRWSNAVAPLAAFLRQPARAADRPSIAADLAPTPAWRLPGRALRVAREGGRGALGEALRQYYRWRRRPR